MDSRQPKKETFAEYVKRVRTEGQLSLEDVERQSGGQISDAYVSRIENGYILNVSPKKLKALAKGLHRTYDEVRAKADGVLVEGDEDFEKSDVAALFYDSRSLSEEDQRELKVIWDMLKQDIRRRKQKQNPRR